MIITTDDIRKYRPIADNLDDKRRLEMYISEVQNLTIIPAIGASLFQQIDENPNEFTELLNGGYYGENDCKKYFAGLKAALVMLTYGKFVKNQPVNVTPFGVKQKDALDSQQTNDKTLVRHANEAENVGLAYLQQCLDYLAFINNDCCTKKKVKSVRINIIGI